MKKLLSIFVLFSLMLCSCGKEIVVERKEFHPSDDEMTAVLNENNTEWTMYRSDQVRFFTTFPPAPLPFTSTSMTTRP